MRRVAERLFGKKSMRQPGVVQAEPRAHHRLVIVSPVYDDLTEVLHKITTRVKHQLGSRGNTPTALSGPGVTRTAVRRLLEHISGAPRTKLFLSHGLAHAILGPPNKDDSDVLLHGSRHAILYDMEDISSTPSKGCVAIACRAGRALGDAFASSGGVWLGYTHDIPFIDEDEYLDVFAGALTNVLAAASENGSLTEETARRYRNTLEIAWAEFSFGARPNPMRSIYAMYIARHIKAVVVKT